MYIMHDKTEKAFLRNYVTRRMENDVTLHAKYPNIS